MGEETLDMDGFPRPRGDVAVATLAHQQGGAVSSEQLQLCGLGPGAIEFRDRRLRLHRMHHGVYAVGRADLTLRGQMWAAVLAYGGDGRAAVADRSAAAAWDLMNASTDEIHVITARTGTPQDGIRLHRSRTFDPRRDVKDHDGLPVTTVGRTLVDLAATLSARQLERVCHQADVLQLLDVGPIHELLATAPRGARKLRAALATEPALTRTEMEEAFFALVTRAGLPRPLVNVPLCGFTVDFVWPEQRRVVETDSRRWHLNVFSFEADRERDIVLELAGYRVSRFTWRQIVERPDLVGARLARLLRR